jgi:hypothetical protein
MLSLLFTLSVFKAMALQRLSYLFNTLFRTLLQEVATLLLGQNFIVCFQIYKRNNKGNKRYVAVGAVPMYCHQQFTSVTIIEYEPIITTQQHHLYTYNHYTQYTRYTFSTLDHVKWYQ